MTGRALVLLLGVIGGVMAAMPLAAQNFSGLTEPLDPDRPDLTDGTATLPPHHYQLEGGYTLTRQGEEKTHTLGELLLRIGVVENVEAHIGIGSYDWIDSGIQAERRLTGYEDPLVGVKVRLAGDNPNRSHAWPHVALIFNTTIPVGSHGISADVWQPQGKLALDWDFTEEFSLGTNFVYSDLSDNGQRFGQFAASVSADQALTKKWGIYLEAYAFSKETANGSSTRYLDTGLSYLVSNDLQLDIRVGRGLDAPHPNWYTGLGAAVRW
jgi:Putative MetA-pathway of phenol degradation